MIRGLATVDSVHLSDTSPPSTSSAGLGTAPPKKSKKVRSACERCRFRRIKCDGQVPACGNCSKAAVLCIDVDGLDTEKRIARGFSAANASARITWLEDIIRTQLPHVNLDDGPLFPATAAADAPEGLLPLEMTSNALNTSPAIARQAIPTQIDLTSIPAESIGSNISAGGNRGQKRPHSSVNAPSSRETSVEQDTRSVALDLGLLSLNSESRQVHYLGSSSGSLFASLFLSRKSDRDTYGSSEAAGSSREIQDGVDGSSNAGHVDTQHLEEIYKAVNTLYEQLRKDLPPRVECDILLKRFFQHMHPNHPFLHRPSFENIVDAIYQCVSSPPNCPIQHNGWPSTVEPFNYNGEEHITRGRRLIPISVHVAAFQLFVALSIGATLQIRSRNYSHNPMLFFNSAISLSRNVFGSISLPVLQAVLLLILHSLIDPEGCNIWTLTHIAMAHAVDLGIHREVSNSGNFSTLAVDMRRRIFFSVYSLDRSICTIKGRPLGLGDDTFDVSLPTLPPSNELIRQTSSASTIADTATMPYSIQVFKMAQYISKIKFQFYRLQNSPDSHQTLGAIAENQHELREELDQWLAESAEIVSATAPPEQRLRLLTKLKIHYHNAMCLLHQPSRVVVHPDEQALQICFESATQRLRLYETLYESGALCHSWRTVQDMFLAGATMMYCVSISSTVRSSVSLSTLARDFRSCSSLLSVGGEWWPMVRQAKSSLERLAGHALEMFSTENARPGTSTSQVMPPPFHVAHSSSSANPYGGSETFSPSMVESALASVLNHEGQLEHILDSTPMSSFMDGIPMYSHDSYAFGEPFWSNLEDNDFTNVTRQARANDREVQDFIDNLANR